MNRKLKYGIIAVFSANIINLIFNLLTNFLLPKYLSVESYAAIKTFQLYTTYIGVFALGCSDGIYLRYGGKQLDSIDLIELKERVNSFRFMLILESMIIIPLSFLIKDKVIICFSFTILSMNMISYFKNLYQAIGEFKRYGKILNLTTIATFISNFFLMFVINTDFYVYYLISYGLVDMIIWFFLEINLFKLIKNIGKVSFSLRCLLEDIKNGFVLMIGNFSNILLSSMDRWFVKITMNTLQFAYYSFAVSLEGFVNLAITPITTTMYNYFCNHMSNEQVTTSRKFITLFGVVIISVAFPAKFIIEMFLPEYAEANAVIFILFATQLVYLVIKGVYINLYKAYKKQQLYFIRLVLILFVGATLNYILVKIFYLKEAFAIGTLISSLVWLFFCIIDFKQYGYTINEACFIFFILISYIIIGILFKSYIGFFIYFFCGLFYGLLFMKVEIKQLYKIIKIHTEKKL